MSTKGWDIQESEELIEDPGLRGRLRFFRLMIVLVLTMLLWRVYWIQQTESEDLQLQANDNQFAELSVNPDRGVIFDRRGRLLAENVPSFDVTITPAFLPSDEDERLRVFERLSVLTGVPVTNTVQQQMLIDQADPALVETYSRLAELYNAPVEETLDEAGVVPQLSDSIIEIYETYSFAQYLPAVITSNVPITLAYQIEQESLFLPGVRVIPRAVRNYPTGEVTSHIIGFMGPLPDESWLDLGYERDDRVGWSGLEVSMEEELAGIKGKRLIEVDWTGRELRELESVEPVDGLNLYLTIDAEVQQKAYEAAIRVMEEARSTERRDIYTGETSYPEIEQVSVVALNPNTGEVLAMVNLPTFDNNRFATEVPVDYYLGLARNDYEPLLNHAIAGQYPPGSTFKLVTGSGALQDGVISPNRLLQAPGQIVIPNRFAPNDPGRSQPFVCWIYQTPAGSHGPQNMLSAIANSCDIYFYKVSGGYHQEGEDIDGLGIEGLHRYATQFGFGRIQGIELPIEAPGNMPTAQWKALNYGEPWSTGDDYNAAIGQGFVTATPMQVAQMAAVVANGGFLYRPSIIHHMTDQDGNLVVRNTDGRLVVVIRDDNGSLSYEDRQGNPIPEEEVTVPIQFDENGEYIFQPEVLNAVDVDQEYLDIIGQGMRLVNQEDGTGSGWADWFDEYDITSAGKTGTAEFCDNIAITKGWCSWNDIENRRILPTHAWYTGFSPYEDPEIAAAAFVFNGDEGSRWAAPIVRDTMAAYFGLNNHLEWNFNRQRWTPVEVEAPVEEGTPEQGLPPGVPEETGGQEEAPAETPETTPPAEETPLLPEGSSGDGGATAVPSP